MQTLNGRTIDFLTTIDNRKFAFYNDGEYPELCEKPDFFRAACDESFVCPKNDEFRKSPEYLLEWYRKADSREFASMKPIETEFAIAWELVM